MFCFKLSKLFVDICSNMNALKSPPNKGFKYLSELFVKKKLIRLVLIESLVVYVEKKTPGALKGNDTPTATPGLVSIGKIFFAPIKLFYLKRNKLNCFK